MKLNLLLALILLAAIPSSNAQNTRINHRNTIGWYNYFGALQLSDKFGLHTEYQWRRNNIIKEWQQSLTRVGVNYHLNPNVLFRGGYAWIETFAYGEYPINGLGRDFSEHRFFEMLQLSHKEGVIHFTHRFMLEQRLIGRYSSESIQVEDEFPFSNRIRYMFRLFIPFKGKEIADKTPYFSFYDEIFIGFGKNVNTNVFDQNRIVGVIGYRFNKHVRLEGGYLHQTLQFGRQINGQQVFQNNNGFIVNANFSMDMSTKRNG